ncbi:MAG TPA: hypothetical protein VFW33_18875, partial [Gemmataceae bacterium]|nr:hypothetical protein [Gemmataceae bacterium]
MKATCHYLLAAAAICALAAGLRFYHLGDWPFDGDELATFEEGGSLLGTVDAPPQSQDYRLPRLAPVGYVFNAAAYAVLGRGEFGSRAAPALLGVGYVVLLLWLLPGTMGRGTALCAALLVAVWPDHLFQSQNHRFYMAAGFFACLGMLLGARAARRGSAPLALLASLAALVALFSHT